MQRDQLSRRVIGLAMEVHKELGPGLLESIYKKCMALELANAGIYFEVEKEVPIVYKGVKTDHNLRVDLLVEKRLIVELKSVIQLLPIHQAQLLTYLKLSKIKTGLLINFNEYQLKNGIKRMVF